MSLRMSKDQKATLTISIVPVSTLIVLAVTAIIVKNPVGAFAWICLVIINLVDVFLWVKADMGKR